MLISQLNVELALYLIQFKLIPQTPTNINLSHFNISKPKVNNRRKYATVLHAQIHTHTPIPLISPFFL